MAVFCIYRILLIAVVARCRSEQSNGFKHNGKTTSQFGDILKPPPPPLSNILPVPFHGGPSRSQRQNIDAGYIYQPPPPPPPPPIPPSNDFKFPAPFYKQYNFHFVPPPQPFTTTPSNSLFQKVSGWLFPSQQNSYEAPVYSTVENNIPTVKKDCNPCNLVPWIPVIRYNVGAKHLQQNSIPTYGPPSPTAYANSLNVAQYRPQPFQSVLSSGVTHQVYGHPTQSQLSTIGPPVSTYGPPSPHSLASQSPPSSTLSFDSSSFSIPSSSYGVPSTSIHQPSSLYGVPSSAYGVPSSSYGVPTSTVTTISPTIRHVNTFAPITPNYDTTQINYNLPSQNDVEILKDILPSNEQQLPKVTHPSGFRNSYGEPISSTYLNVPYPISATAAESTKIRTDVLPNENNMTTSSNLSLALANPAPFTLKGGRNIHTLQPVALPNLSVSPLPPIFNARPFRPITAQFTKNFVQGINLNQQVKNNNDIENSRPVAEFTHSIDYRPTFVKSTLIDLDASKNFNQSKAYRNFPNGYVVDENRDISSQASEDHVSSANQDASFETTGIDFGNDLYDANLPTDMRYGNKVPTNHKDGFADLRGVKDKDVDKYRTENNLQNIDSPLLYLKPSAPHKDFGNFVLAVSTPLTENDYELYDDTSTTAAPQISTLTSAWDESRTDYGEGLLPPPQEDSNKPKIVQIIVPYTTGQQDSQNPLNFSNIKQQWPLTSEDDYQGRKVPSNTEYPFNTVTESYSTVSTTTEEPIQSNTEFYDSNRLNTQAIFNDLYDVKEPPFDIIKLQHTIDDWTEQEYSKHYQMPQQSRTSAKFAKQIPDEYFTTLNPISNYVTAATNYKYEFYDHEGSSSVHHPVMDDKNETAPKLHKEYNTIERTKAKHSSGKNDETEEGKKPHIYTAASSFRSSTTLAPWETIQTSISPLTKEKIYVVTSKPWRDSISEKPQNWYDAEMFDSKRTNADNDVSASDNLPFQSPRFSNRPSFGFSSSGSGKVEPLKSDSSYAFSKSWHQSINELENQARNSTGKIGGSQHISTTNSYGDANLSNMDEDTATTMTAELLEDSESTESEDTRTLNV